MFVELFKRFDEGLCGLFRVEPIPRRGDRIEPYSHTHIFKLPSTFDWPQMNRNSEANKVSREAEKLRETKSKRLAEVMRADDLVVASRNAPKFNRDGVSSFYDIYGDYKVSNDFIDELEEAQKLKNLWANKHIKDILNVPIEIEIIDEVEIPRSLRRMFGYIYNLKQEMERHLPALIREEDVIVTKDVMKLQEYLKSVKYSYPKILEENKLGEGRSKLSKDITAIHKKAKALASLLRDNYDKVKGFTLQRPYERIYNEASNVVSEALETTLEALQEHQSKKGGKSVRTFYITENVVEMLGASENCGWSSCFRIEGEYHQGAIGMARTPSAFMAYEIRKESEDIIVNKLSRAWVLFSEDAEVLKVPTLYTSTSNHEGVRKMLANKIADMMWANRPSSKGSELVVVHEGNFYEDSGSTRCKHTEGKGRVRVGLGMLPDGENCSSGYFTGEDQCSCEDCGERGHEDEFTWIDSIDAYVCDSCFSDNYGRCEECDTAYHQNNITHTGDSTIVCDNCLGDSYHEALETGEYHHTDGMVYLDYRDAYTLIDNATICEYCSEAFLHEDVTYVEGYGEVGNMYLEEVYEENPELRPDYEEGEDDDE